MPVFFDENPSIAWPSGFTTPPSGQQWTPPFTVRRTGSAYATDFDVTTLIPAITTTYYVDPNNGNNSNTGTSRSSPLLSLSVALAKSNVDQVRIINMSSNYIARSSHGWNNTQATRSVSVINEGPGRFISAGTSSAAQMSWTVNSTYSNVYQAAATNANAGNSIDLKYSSSVSNRVTGVSMPVAYSPMVHVGSVAAVAATAGTWYCDNTNVYVNLIDGRTAVNDPYLIVTQVANNGRFPASTNNITVYIQGIDFLGGTAPFLAGLSSSSVTGCVLVHNNCSFQCANYFSSNGPNGLSVIGNMTVYGLNSLFANNCTDGDNFHSYESDGTTLNTSPREFSNGCVSLGNGTWGSQGTSDNAFTAHDDCRIVLLNCDAPTSDDGIFAYTNFSRCVLFGCRSGYCVQTSAGSNYGFGALVSNNMWLDGCIADPPSAGGSQVQMASTTSVINYTNMPTPSTGGTVTSPGTLQQYIE